ncbi:MAG: hypothetical protein QM784_37445 [Polyangiaceae bacterium]
MLTRRRSHFTKGDRAPVAELACPVTELMPAVTRRNGHHPRECPIAGKHVEEFLGVGVGLVESEHLGNVHGHRNQGGLTHGRRHHLRKACAVDLSGMVCAIRIERKFRE